jgi:hypothetical protein
MRADELDTGSVGGRKQAAKPNRNRADAVLTSIKNAVFVSSPLQ